MTFEQLVAEMQKSMKEKNRVKKDVLADIVACAKNMAIAEGCKDNISEKIVTNAILKSKKICQEQIDTCPANRPDILEGYKLCMSYIDEYAPKMMSEEEVRKAVYHLLATIDIQQDNKGAVMKAIMPHLKGKADGKVINSIVTEIISKSL